MKSENTCCRIAHFYLSHQNSIIHSSFIFVFGCVIYVILCSAVLQRFSLRRVSTTYIFNCALRKQLIFIQTKQSIGLILWVSIIDWKHEGHLDKWGGCLSLLFLWLSVTLILLPSFYSCNILILQMFWLLYKQLYGFSWVVLVGIVLIFKVCHFLCFVWIHA